jgi:hypothetical protein
MVIGKFRMPTERVDIRELVRGDLIVREIDGGHLITVAETSAFTYDGVRRLIHDNTEARVWADDDGMVRVARAPFHTQRVGRTSIRGAWHLLDAGSDDGMCPPSRGKITDRWESGTAVSGITCRGCVATFGIFSRTLVG